MKPGTAFRPARDSTALTLACIACGVVPAILGYRPYDLDSVTNRVLVHGALSASLIVAYFGSVVGRRYDFRPLGGGESLPAVAASTPLVAAPFDPLRRRMQGSIDRRFYPGKYDAARVPEPHAATLRDVTDPASSGEGLAGCSPRRCGRPTSRVALGRAGRAHGHPRHPPGTRAQRGRDGGKRAAPRRRPARARRAKEDHERDD